MDQIKLYNISEKRKNYLKAIISICLFFILPETTIAETLVKKRIDLKHINYEIAQKEARTFLSESGNIEPGDNFRQILITDKQENIKRIENTIRVLDVPANYIQASDSNQNNAGNTQEAEKEVPIEPLLVETITLKNVSSMSAKDILRDLFQNSNQSSLTTGEVTIKDLQEKNALVIMANEHDMKILKESIQNIDIKSANNQEVTTRVVYLQNTLVGEVLNTLQMMKGDNQRRRGRNNENNTTISEDVIISSLDNNNSIVLSGPLPEVTKVQNMISQIDMLPKQVLIEIMILEVSLKNGSLNGVEWQWKKGDLVSKKGRTQTGTNFGIRPQYDAGASNGFVFSFESEYFSAILQSLEDSGDVRIVSAPHILVTNNQRAEIVIGDRVVINKESLEIPSADNSKPIIRTTRDYVDVGLKLQLTPKIGSDDKVYIDILQEVNDIKNSGIPGFPEIAKRSLKTNILVSDRQSAALGGLISKKKTKIQSKVGILGSLPVLGRIFRKEEITTQNNELILFVTAYIVNGNNDLQIITETQKKKIHEINNKILNNKRKNNDIKEK